MHDPMTLAFEVPAPWFRRDTVSGRIRFATLFDIWHHDPSDYDSETCDLRGERWKWHVQHWRVRVIPWRRWRRRHLTRCEYCGQKDRRGLVNVSLGWDRSDTPWWRGERGLYHARCSDRVRAGR